MELDRKDLKIEGYKQKVSELEDKVMDLRVELTLVTQARDAILKEFQEWKESNVSAQETAKPESTD